MTIRKANDGDASAMAEIFNQYIGLATMDLEEKSSGDYIQILRDLHPREAIYVIDDHGKAIGWGIIKRYSYKEGYSRACETSVFIHEKYRGKGYGTQMKKHLIDRSKYLGYRHLVAKIWASNKVSINYNLKLGYTIVGVQQKVGFIEGKWIDVVIMQYLIDNDHVSLG